MVKPKSHVKLTVLRSPLLALTSTLNSHPHTPVNSQPNFSSRNIRSVFA